MATTTDALADPQAIRDRLPAGQRAAFDIEYQRALAVARDELRVDDLQQTLRMWDQVATTLATGAPPAGTASWDDVRQHLGV